MAAALFGVTALLEEDWGSDYEGPSYQPPQYAPGVGRCYYASEDVTFIPDPDWLPREPRRPAYNKVNNLGLVMVGLFAVSVYLLRLGRRLQTGGRS